MEQSLTGVNQRHQIEKNQDGFQKITSVLLHVNGHQEWCDQYNRCAKRAKQGFRAQIDDQTDQPCRDRRRQDQKQVESQPYPVHLFQTTAATYRNRFTKRGHVPRGGEKHYNALPMESRQKKNPPFPALFVSHNAPTLALDQAKGADFRRMAEQMPRPRAILAISAHWESHDEILIGCEERCELIYDFYGFPQALYELDYAAPTAPELVDQVQALLEPHIRIRREPGRGWDHGVWVPLRLMYPQAEFPLLQISLPRGPSGSQLLQLGAALAPLRRQGVLILASGAATHNLASLDLTDRAAPHDWALDFDHWLATTLEHHDHAQLGQYQASAPHFDLAHPTDEHFTPLLLAAGAGGFREPVSFPIKGFEFGNLSRRCVRFG